MIHRPELYAQLAAGNQALLTAMVDKGLLDPAGFLNQPAGSTPLNPLTMMGNMGFPGMPSTQQLSGGNPVGQQPQITTSSSGGNDIHVRMREEISYLEKISGVKVQAKPGADNSNIPDGSYDLKVEIPRTSGGLITLYLNCPAGYPQKPPTADVEVDGQDTAFQSAILRRWMGQYLVEIAREVKQYFG
mgnify:FL=1